MTTQPDLVLAAAYGTLAIPDIHYAVCGTRCRPDLPPHCEDCSGCATYALHAGGVATPAPCMDSRTLAAWCRGAGTSMSIATAKATPASMVFLGPPGAEHHVAFSTGDGRVFAARGVHATPHIGFTPFNVDAWDSAGWAPGLARTPLHDPLPGPTSPGEAAAMGFICGAVVPGAKAQEHPHQWEGRAPFVAVHRTADGHWHMVGLDGAHLLNRDFQGHPAKVGFGLTDVDLGPLNGAIFDKDTPSSGAFAGKIVFLADDGGTYVPEVRVDYPASG